METAGWLGGGYFWVKASHIIFVIFWMSSLFMLPRQLLYHRPAAPGSPEDLLWQRRERTLLRVIAIPSMIAVWLLGLALAFNVGWQGGWLHLKLVVVLALSAYHGWLESVVKRYAAGLRPLSERSLRLAGEAPALATIAIVILAVVKPF